MRHKSKRKKHRLTIHTFKLKYSEPGKERKAVYRARVKLGKINIDVGGDSEDEAMINALESIVKRRRKAKKKDKKTKRG